MAQKVFEDKEFHGLVTFFKNVIIKTVAGWVVEGDIKLSSLKKLYFDGGSDTYITETSANVLQVFVNGSTTIEFSSTGISGSSGSSRAKVVFSANASNTVPVLLPKKNDADTGIGSSGANQLSLIAEATECARVYGGGLQLLNVLERGGDSAGEAISVIPAGVSRVTVTAVENDADDFVLLPAGLAGMDLWIYCDASSNFELRTPTSSSETINGVDASGGAVEYLMTDTDAVHLHCIADGVWIANDHLVAGGLRSAHVPN